MSKVDNPSGSTFNERNADPANKSDPIPVKSDELETTPSSTNSGERHVQNGVRVYLSVPGSRVHQSTRYPRDARAGANRALGDRAHELDDRAREPTGGGDVLDPLVKPEPDLEVDDPDVAEVDASPLPYHGFGLVRIGFREVGTGFVEEARAKLELLRRFLPRRVRTIRTRRLALVLLLVMVIAIGVVIATVSAVATSLAGPTSVVVSTAGPSVINDRPGGVGSLSSSPQHVAVVSLNVQGVTAPIEVTAVDVVAGEQVAAGAPLLQLNPLPFEQNQLQVAATLQQAEQTLSSAQSAAASGASGTANAYLAVQIPTIQGQVAIDQQLLQIATGNTTSLNAPISGSISYVRTAPGQVVSLGTSLVQIIDPTQVDVSTGMQLSDLQSISTGESATVTPTELPGVNLYGKVIAVSSSAANGGLEGTVVVAVTNRPNHPVPIGTQAFVTISAPVHAAVSVPSVAIQNIEINPAVAVVQNNRVHFQPVVVGASDTSRTQILSGLHAGERVAFSNLQVLNDGDQVKDSSGHS